MVIEKPKYLGVYERYSGLWIYEIDKKRIVLNEWNGESYFNNFEVDKNNHYIKDYPHEIRPIYEEKGEDDFELIGFEVI